MNRVIEEKTIRAFYQPSSSSVVGDWGAAVDSIYTLPSVCKGAMLKTTSAADGVLEVHLIDDAATRWFLLPLERGKPIGAIFDKIRTTNSTAVIADVYVFPA